MSTIFPLVNVNILCLKLLGGPHKCVQNTFSSSLKQQQQNKRTLTMPEKCVHQIQETNEWNYFKLLSFSTLKLFIALGSITFVSYYTV